ncbi:MAG: glycosyltransferase [Ilumatobacter sp.]|nr:glycosyltransferase [Ilumatobacter sp.]
MNPPLIPAVVVTHEGPSGRLSRCLTALHDAGGIGPVIVIDNSEQQSNSEAHLEDLNDTVVIQTTNRGYGAAANEGFNEVRQRCPSATAIALLNDDVTVTAGWIEGLSDALTQGWNVAQPKLLMTSSMAADVALVNSAGVTLDRHGAGVDIGYGEPDSSVFDGIADIEIFTGGAALFSLAFLDLTGGFDERFFLYYEDVDLALRGRELGQRYTCVPDSIVWHEGGASTSALGVTTRYMQDRNRLWCAIRFGRSSTIARAIWLSLRRLRCAPYVAHWRALAGGLAGGPRRLWERSQARQSRLCNKDALTPLSGVHTEGVNLLGYHHSASGLGTAVRQLHRSLAAAGVAVSIFDVDTSNSPRIESVNSTQGSTIVRQTTLAVVTAPELPGALAARPKLRTVDRVVGYWFWEVAEVPATHQSGIDLVDEIWAPTTFIADAYRSVPNGPPVTHQPMYLACPTLCDGAQAQWRRRFAPNDEFLFLVTLDLFSIVERKNPFGAIDAFAAAFKPSDLTARLVIKTLNGNQRPEALARIADHAAQSGITDQIEIFDSFISDDEMTGLIAAADCFVSLHRGEGLGLQLAAAMWLETPVIASRYSGNLDFMSDKTAGLIDVTLIDVEHGEGAYPDGFQWADPDLGQAAAWMKRMVNESGCRQQLREAALRYMREQPAEEWLGQNYSRTLDFTPQPGR